MVFGSRQGKAVGILIFGLVFALAHHLFYSKQSTHFSIALDFRVCILFIFADEIICTFLDEHV
jgi:hypothetical protein